jgi:hypothetical protein
LTGLDVIFPGYYPDSLPVDLPENKTTTTTDPIRADGNSTAPKRKSTLGYPVDWSAVAMITGITGITGPSTWDQGKVHR